MTALAAGAFVVFFVVVFAGAGSAVVALDLLDRLGAAADSEASPVVPSSARFLYSPLDFGRLGEWKILHTFGGIFNSMNPIF